ncbi:TetR/AcrR family transcriptional regulator [Inquilinus sp.]|uniref:TetR/AcrR family transcriptional regulator n=1 Tax=Inquilinus sp. TaxID=1932117 RepID=UPI0031E32D6C
MSTRIPGPSSAMRKRPRQARSRATVAAVVQAGAQLLGEKGWAGFTTNEVAEVAGVSIGSLYQYFPNKLALVDAIRQRHFDEVLAVLDRAADGGTPAEALVDGMIAVHSANAALHRVLLDLPDPDGSGAAYRAFQAEYLRRYEAVVAALDGGRDGIVAQVLSSAVEGVIHNAARRGVLQSPEVRRELTRLVLGYLGRGA